MSLRYYDRNFNYDLFANQPLFFRIGKELCKLDFTVKLIAIDNHRDSSKLKAENDVFLFISWANAWVLKILEWFEEIKVKIPVTCKIRSDPLFIRTLRCNFSGRMSGVRETLKGMFGRREERGMVCLYDSIESHSCKSEYSHFQAVNQAAEMAHALASATWRTVDYN